MKEISMRTKTLTILILLISATLAASTSLADVNGRMLAKLTLQETPLDMSMSRDGRWLFLLTDQGHLLIYSTQGQYNGKIEVGLGYDQVEAGAREDQVYLLNCKQKHIEIVQVAFTFDIDTSNSPYRGAADAPVVIVEYTDFQCPYCAHLGGTLDQMMRLYPGKLKIVYKSFPLSSHKYSWQAATAAMAANKKGKFWPFYKELFDNYNKLDDAKLLEIRKHFGFDNPEFEALMNSPEIRTQVAFDRNEGTRLGVHGTPTVFINGKRLLNKRPEGFKAAIEEALKEAKK
jgi:predicted DsbA family dithiol-disulfide isomerase